MNKCYKCGESDVQEEFTRCPACEAEHKKLCAELDAKPKAHVEKVKEELIGFKSMRQGVEVTTFMNREEARLLGLKIPPEYE